MEILYEHCFNWLWPEVKNLMVSATTSLTGFSGETIWPLGQLRLLVTIGDIDHSTRAWMNFMIVRLLSPYNGIIRRPRIREIQAVPSTAHKMLKFPVDGGIVTIRSTILIPAECTTLITSSAVSKEPSDMTGVPRSVPEHRLNIREGYSSVRQKKRGQAPERAKAIQAELQKLPIHKIVTPPEIDWKVESLCAYPFKCFLDAYKGYHQLQLAESDEEKTVFHTGQGVYCYTKMLFGLKNAGATYQRLVDKAFDIQIGRNVEVYVNDLVIKSHTEAEMLRDINETFRTLRKINMKLNPQKCAFGAVEGVFLGYVKCIKKSDFHWIAEAEQALKQLKQHLSESPLLVAPKPNEELIVYLSATYGAISAVLMTERWAIQRPPRDFEGEHNITYRPRTLVKGQVLADFLTKMPDENPPAAPVVETQQEPWTLFMDGSSCVDGSDAGLILTSPKGTKFNYTLRFQFAAFNNEAECEAIIAGLRIAAQMREQNVHVSVDFKLVANQVLETYFAKEENMIKYLEKVKSLVNGFTNFSISQVPRSKNKKEDALSKITSTSFVNLSKQVLVEVLKEKSIKEKEVTTVVEEDGPTWMTLIMEYLKEGTLPSDRKEARKLCIKARQYELLEGVLYRRSFFTPWLRCVGPLQAEYVIRKIHEGSCSMHVGPRSVVAKAIRLGYYWPMMHRDARDMILKHPQSNRLVESANQSLGEGIKARLGVGNNNWVEELPYVLWAHRTMIKSSHGDRPFSLTYGTEAVIPVEIRMSMYRTTVVDVVYNDEEPRLKLDLLKE
nr:hypothetical protein [Tanacetum cinerariifolium]